MREMSDVPDGDGTLQIVLTSRRQQALFREREWAVVGKTLSEEAEGCRRTLRNAWPIWFGMRSSMNRDICPSGETRSQNGDELVKLPAHAATQHTTGGDTARSKAREKVVTQGSRRTFRCRVHG